MKHSIITLFVLCFSSLCSFAQSDDLINMLSCVLQAENRYELNLDGREVIISESHNSQCTTIQYISVCDIERIYFASALNDGTAIVFECGNSEKCIEIFSNCFDGRNYYKPSLTLFINSDTCPAVDWDEELVRIKKRVCF
jgi:hypothetical protein